MGLCAVFIEVTQRRVWWRRQAQNAISDEATYSIADRVFREVLEIISRHREIDKQRAAAKAVPAKVDGQALYRACRSALNRLAHSDRPGAIKILERALKKT